MSGTIISVTRAIDLIPPMMTAAVMSAVARPIVQRFSLRKVPRPPVPATLTS